MSSHRARTAPLGDVDPAGSRHRGRRSGVALTDDRIVVGTADGRVRGFDRALDEQWTIEPNPAADGEPGKPVTLATLDEQVIVGHRGPDGLLRGIDPADGTVRWRHETAEDLGPAQKETRFYYPFVVSAASDGERAYVAARRYERDDGRHFESVVYALDPDGSEAWRYAADASPISVDCDGERVAIAYNRCPGDHQCGLVVLDATDGGLVATWDPGTDGQRRVGDVALCEEGIAVASHGDYRGYLLDPEGDVQWAVDLGRPVDAGDERVYAYPNHVHESGDCVGFVTGSTYPEAGRETQARHPREYTVCRYTKSGEPLGDAATGGFAPEVGTAGSLLAVPGAQHFRDRTPASHGLWTVDLATGREERIETDGIVTSVAVDDERIAAIEEPVEYHDEGRERGRYRLHRHGQ